MHAPKSQRTAPDTLAGDAADAVRLPGPDVTNPARLDKVRDILFGNQARDVERRFTRLEERLVKDTADVKGEVRKRSTPSRRSCAGRRSRSRDRSRQSGATGRTLDLVSSILHERGCQLTAMPVFRLSSGRLSRRPTK